MTSQGSAQGRFQRAIKRRNLFAAEMALRELDYISLANALALTLLICEEAPQRYERAAVRWHVRFVEEAKGIGLKDSQLALASLAALFGPGDEAAAATLAQLARTYGVAGIEAVLRGQLLHRCKRGVRASTPHLHRAADAPFRSTAGAQACPKFQG
jgi:hypothetical protein